MIAVEQRERYVTRRELAGQLGISERTIDGLVGDGMPSETWGMKRTRRFLVSSCVAWLRDREQGRVPADRDRTETAPGDNRV